MPPPNLPLRWESTKDQWWYASPIDFAAANGHYDLVRELLHLDTNHLINLTSLPRIRRLETLWDNEDQFNKVAKCRSRVAKKLFLECESKREGKNSLIKAGYGGWLIYTAASAGDMSFVRNLLEKDPFLVFGEREYGITDILCGAAKSKNSAVFRTLVDFAVSPRFGGGKCDYLKENARKIPRDFKMEMINRAIFAAARGGNLQILKELIQECTDVLAYRDAHGSTILHAAAGRGQVEILKHLIASYDIINSTDNHGNTALHVAALRGKLSAVEAIILASPSSILARNNSGETFLHMAVLGFQSPVFQRLDRQVELMKWLISCRAFDIEHIINAKDNGGRTALHEAVIGNIKSELLEILMDVPSVDLNVQDLNGMTPLDLLRMQPPSSSSDTLMRQLISSGGISGFQDNFARRAITSCLKMQANRGSPGTCFRVPDGEILSHTRIKNSSDSNADRNSAELSHLDLAKGTSSSELRRKRHSVSYAAERLKKVFQWNRAKERAKEVGLSGLNGNLSASDESPVPLRERFSKASSLPKNKRILSVRNSFSVPSTTKKKFASGVVHGVMEVVPHLTVSRHASSSSFSEQSFSLFNYSGKGRSCSDERQFDDETPRLSGGRSSFNKSLRFCFGAQGLSV